ncbi:maleylacetoacetate isomerase [Legionella yabuuchiae]|uniref:maleylacetoacetate isomerase n=1 Tax=Legionella yabuuchiae TaxID=376727 RepID=UPI00105454A6|nr:maleylacetoacetate isomerase [Legionella yabuuchiae]
MKLYDYYRSSASYRVRIALNLKQVSYDSIPIHLVNHGGEQHHPNYLILNPQGLVPTLVENGHVLTQSLAIIEYLNEIIPEPPLLPQSPLERANARSLAYIIACDIHPLNNLRVLNELRTLLSATDDDINQWYHLWLKKGFESIENRLQQLSRKKPVCVGKEVSIADICLIPQIYNAKRFNLSLDEYPLINEINNFCLTIPEFSNASPEHQKQSG